MFSVLIVAFGAFVYLNLNRFTQFVVLSLAALLPFTFGDFRSIPSFLWIEWLPFITLLIIINDLFLINKAKKRYELISFNGTGIFIISIIILIIWTLVSFMNHEILSQSLSYAEKTGTTRIYFRIANNVLLFFVTIVFVAIYFEKIDFFKFLKIILYFSLLLGALRIFSHFFEFQIPLIRGEFTYGGEYGKYAKLRYGGTAYRFGGLNDIVSIGIPALFSYYLYTKKFNFIALLVFIFYLFISGGRTIAVGTIMSIIIFSFIFFPKNFFYLISGGGVLLILALIIFPDTILQGQAGRMTTFKSGFMGMDSQRALAWKYYIEIFLANPFFGKGIVEFRDFIVPLSSSSTDFVYDQLVSGGHGSYISLLSTFGLGGIIYFILMLFGGIIISYRKINQFINTNIEKTAVAIFTFVLLLIKSFDYLTAKDGLSMPIFFYTVGLIVSLQVLENNEEILH